MHNKFPNNIALLRKLRRNIDEIPVDFGGGCSLAESFLISHLILEHNLKNYVEIGIYRGRSFFAAAYTTKLLAGMAYGIDPYDDENPDAFDLEDSFQKDSNAFLALSNLGQIYDEVLKLRDEWDFTNTSMIIRENSIIAVNYFRRNKISVDMLHINRNLNTKQVLKDIELYLPFIRSGGFVVIDDVNVDTTTPAVNFLKRKFDIVFNNGQFAIFSVGTPRRKIDQLSKSRFNILHGMVENLELNRTERRALISESTENLVISVVVITYNQEKYIAECLEGIFAQKGDFKIELVIGEDYSTDNTLKIIKKYVDSLGNSGITVKILTGDKNIGMTKNLQRCFAACTGSYIAVCEGDDFWIDPNKLQKQMDFLKFHPECALCFNDIYLYFQESEKLTKFDLQQRLDADVFTTRELVLDYYVGNLSCCLYDARFMNKIPNSLFDLYIGDWMFNIYYSQFGDIGHIKEIMSVYRKHNKGVWAGGNHEEQNFLLWNLIEDYNKFTSYNYDPEFSIVQRRIESAYTSVFTKVPVELAIIDDAFPHPLSAFRTQEFSSYLEKFNQIRIYSSGGAVGFLGGKKLDELIADFKRENPEYSSRIRKLESDTIINARLFYFDFLINAYSNLERIEQSGKPFVFTLYPGGGFGLDITESDRMLYRVTSSPCFKKVIVTQKVTYDYLITKGYCTPDQIEFIFGVVIPLNQIDAEYTGKKHYGFEKNTLDICFVAYKYTKKGIDKGYDVFIDVAHQLCRKHDDIQFHVVGGIDENEIDVGDLKGRIAFYGKRDMPWFDSFYKDKDIILSPNIPGIMYPGSFDGFPTGSCVDAGLRKTVIFCTDELGLNNNYFSEGNEIVIIPHDAEKITSIIENYHDRPEKLKDISENGCLRIKQLFNYDAQILPRINLLKNEIDQAKRNKKAFIKAVDSAFDVEKKVMDSGSLPAGHRKIYNIESLRELIVLVGEPGQASTETTQSKVWKSAMVIRRILVKLAPPSSRRARLLRRLYNDLFMKIWVFAKNQNSKRDLVLIRSSDLFNEAWYLENNHDVIQANMDPALHYWIYGGFEGRDPGPKFSSDGYLDTYPDVRIAKINPLVHYLKYGQKEGRVISTRNKSNESTKHRFRCPVCKEKIQAFAPLNSYYEENWKKYGFLYNLEDFETLNSSNYFCPKCGASDRDRLYALYLTQILSQDPSRIPIKILDFAPANALKHFLLNYSIVDYKSADKFMEDVDFVVDIADMKIIDQEAFDFFICSHVLEHVADDYKALSELYRILKPGGSGILMVPINLRIEKIREDPSLTDIGERWRRFGQDDHIRLYSKKGFIDRVQGAGFTITQYGVDYFGEEVFSLHGISSKSILYLVKKN
jgi:glycosyltransferase involved in cell wall biosynthesis/SAM-dependent methyltransferase